MYQHFNKICSNWQCCIVMIEKGKECLDKRSTSGTLTNCSS